MSEELLLNLDALELQLRRRVLESLRPIITFGGVPTVALALLSHHDHHVWLGVLMCGFTLLLAALWLSPGDERRRGLVFAFGTVFLSLGSLHQFGPNVGAGLLLMASVFTLNLFAAPRVAWASVGAMALVAAAVVVSRDTEELIDLSRKVFSVMGVLLIAQFAAAQVMSAQRVGLEQLVRAQAERDRAEAQAQHLRQLAESRQRLEALGELVGGVAHDFNNAITVILSGANYLKGEPDAEDRMEVFDEIRDGALRAQATTRQLLSLGRNRPSEEGVCMPGELVPRLGHTLERLLPRGIRIEFDCQPTGEVSLAAPALEQALINLIINARDAMPSGGALTLRTLETDTTVTMEVRDTGTGMPPEVKERVFQPFFSTKGERGTGLGLAMVHSLITRHGGQVAVDSTPGVGTAFTLSLPKVGTSDPGPHLRAVS